MARPLPVEEDGMTEVVFQTDVPLQMHLPVPLRREDQTTGYFCNHSYVWQYKRRREDSDDKHPDQYLFRAFLLIIRRNNDEFRQRRY